MSVINVCAITIQRLRDRRTCTHERDARGLVRCERERCSQQQTRAGVQHGIVQACRVSKR